MNKRVDMILNSIEGITLVDFNLLLEDTDFRKLFLELFNNKENDNRAIIEKSVEYIKNNY